MASLQGRIVIDGVGAAVHEVRLVPESGAAGVLQELLPPPPMRLGTSPAFEGGGLLTLA
jgi:hypothetical protein